MSDADPVWRARTTDGQAALAALCRRYLTPVYRYFFARTGDVQHAEDLTAQTFVATFEILVQAMRDEYLRQPEHSETRRPGAILPAPGLFA